MLWWPLVGQPMAMLCCLTLLFKRQRLCLLLSPFPMQNLDSLSSFSCPESLGAAHSHNGESWVPPLPAPREGALPRVPAGLK